MDEIRCAEDIRRFLEEQTRAKRFATWLSRRRRGAPVNEDAPLKPSDAYQEAANLISSFDMTIRRSCKEEFVKYFDLILTHPSDLYRGAAVLAAIRCAADDAELASDNRVHILMQLLAKARKELA